MPSLEKEVDETGEKGEQRNEQAKQEEVTWQPGFSLNKQMSHDIQK